MNKFKYELETKTEVDTITQVMYSYSDTDEQTQRELMYVNVMQTQDVSQRQALEKLGLTYTPCRKPTWSERFKSWLSEVQ